LKRAIPTVAETKQLRPAALSYADAALYLGLSVKTLRNKVSRGEFPVKPRRLGGKPLFLVAELDSLLSSLPAVE